MLSKLEIMRLRSLVAAAYIYQNSDILLKHLLLLRKMHKITPYQQTQVLYLLRCFSSDWSSELDNIFT